MTTPSQQPTRPDVGSETESQRPEADDQFLRRILIGLVTATVISGAVTVGLTAQQLRPDLIQIASLWGPA